MDNPKSNLIDLNNPPVPYHGTFHRIIQMEKLEKTTIHCLYWETKDYKTSQSETDRYALSIGFDKEKLNEVRNLSDKKDELTIDVLTLYNKSLEEKDRCYYQMFNIPCELYFSEKSMYNSQLFEKPVIVCLEKNNPFLDDETMTFLGPLELYKYYDEGINNP